MLEVCVGSDLRLPWNFTLAPDETVEDIKWTYFAENRAGEMIAMMTGPNFLAMPAFSGRVQFGGEGAEIVVSRAGIYDTGNYSVEVTTEDPSHRLVRAHRTVFVQVVGKDCKYSNICTVPFRLLGSILPL